MDRVSEWLRAWIGLYGMRIVATVLILLVGRYIAIGARGLVRRIMRRGNIEETLASFTASVTYAVVMVFVVVTALGQLGVPTASFIAVIGAAGLAIGFALQGSLANFAAGVLVIVFKPFKVGDYIEGGGTAGTVEEISFFTTELKSPDNRKIVVPNSKITSDNIVNYSARETRRVDVIASISYGDDIDKARKVLETVISSQPEVLGDPAPAIMVGQLAESSVDLTVRVWVNTPDYWTVFFSFQEKIKKAFDAQGITIPFPQRDVHVYREDGGGVAGNP